MSPPPQSRLLQITIISAHDLPPISKLLRTFAVAYIHPDDDRFNTKIDHQGHTNPTWNSKMSFPVDDRFLDNPSAAVNFEIYNLAWLRDLPVGTARLAVGRLSPPLHKNQAYRRVSVRISRPSGHLRGTLHLGVQLVDNTNPSGDARPSPIKCKQKEERERSDFYEKREIGIPGQETNPGARNINPNSKICNRANNYSQMQQPLPGEAQTGPRKGLLSSIEWDDYRASILESWMESESMKTTPEESPVKARRGEEKKKAGLLLSCFGNGDGLQMGFLCG